MPELQLPPHRVVLFETKPGPQTPASERRPAGPFSADEWTKLHHEDRRLAAVLGVMALSILTIALAVYGTIAFVAALGRP